MWRKTTRNAHVHLQVTKSWALQLRTRKQLQAELPCTNNTTQRSHKARTAGEQILQAQQSSKGASAWAVDETEKRKPLFRKCSYRRFGGRIRAGMVSCSSNGRFQICFSTRIPRPCKVNVPFLGATIWHALATLTCSR